MPLGQGIGETWEAVRDRIEVAGHGPTWQITGGSFEGALGYARERFGDPFVLRRKDRDRWWPRVTLTVTTDPALATGAPPLEELARPPAPAAPPPRPLPSPADRSDFRVSTDPLPASLEAIFAHQEQQRMARHRIPEQRTRAGSTADAGS